MGLWSDETSTSGRTLQSRTLKQAEEFAHDVSTTDTPLGWNVVGVQPRMSREIPRPDIQSARISPLSLDSPESQTGDLALKFPKMKTGESKKGVKTTPKRSSHRMNSFLLSLGKISGANVTLTPGDDTIPYPGRNPDTISFEPIPSM